MAQYRVPELGSFNWQQNVSDQVTAPTESEAKGTRYIIKAVASGIFEGHETKIATANTANPAEIGDWILDTPLEGWITWDETLNKYLAFNGTAWIAVIDPANPPDMDSVDARVSGVESVNVVQDASISSINVVDTNISSSLASVDTVASVAASTNVVQDSSIASLVVVDTNISSSLASVDTVASVAYAGMAVWDSDLSALTFTL